MGTHLICLIIIFFSLCTRLSASQALHAQSPRSKQYLYDNIRIGAGYDSISGEFKKNCIVKVGSPITFDFSDQKLFELQQINSLSQLVQALELPLTAILPSPPHPLFKEKNDFLKLIAFNRFNSFMLAKAKISLTEKKYWRFDIKGKIHRIFERKWHWSIHRKMRRLIPKQVLNGNRVFFSFRI